VVKQSDEEESVKEKYINWKAFNQGGTFKRATIREMIQRGKADGWGGRLKKEGPSQIGGEFGTGKTDLGEINGKPDLKRTPMVTESEKKFRSIKMQASSRCDRAKENGMEESKREGRKKRFNQLSKSYGTIETVEWEVGRSTNVLQRSRIKETKYSLASLKCGAGFRGRG